MFIFGSVVFYAVCSFCLRYAILEYILIIILALYRINETVLVYTLVPFDCRIS